MKTIAIVAVLATALLVPACGWASEENTNNEGLLLATAIFTGNWSALVATVAEEKEVVETKLSDRLELSTWLSWGGTYDGENEGSINSTRLRVDADFGRGFSATVEHDFRDHVNGNKLRWPHESGLKKAELKWSSPLPKGGKITLAGGQHLDSVAFLYPSPATLPTTRYPITA